MAIGDTLPVYGASVSVPNVHRVRSRRMLYISAVCAALMVSAVVALTFSSRSSSTTLVATHVPAHPALAGQAIAGKAITSAAAPAKAVGKPVVDPDSTHFEAAKKLADEFFKRFVKLMTDRAAAGA